MKNKVILTDADGVLVNWNKAFEKFMSIEGYPKIEGTDHEYNLTHRHGLDARRILDYVAEFNESSEIAKLEPFADSVEYVKKLANLGFSFIVITSISDHPLAKINRTTNLTELFGPIFKEIHCIEMGASKYHTLLEWADTGYFWIEDHMRQAEAGYEVGLRPLLIDHPYNSHYLTDLFPKVSHQNPWKEIYDIVITDYNIV
jgi:hypothetical protein